MVAPAFGFGAGDFVDAVAFLARIAKALRETTGASRQFQQAAAELEALRAVLVRVESLEPSASNVDIVEKIQVCAHVCHLPLASFISKAEKFETRLGHHQTSSTDGTNVWDQSRIAAKKIQWAEFLESELSALKARIGPLIAAISLLLELEVLQNLEESKIEISQSRALAEKTLLSVNELKAFLLNTAAEQSHTNQLLDGLRTLSTQQTQDGSELLSLARGNQSQTKELRDKLDIHETLLRTLIERAGVTNQPSMPLSGSPSATDRSTSQQVSRARRDPHQNVMILSIRDGLAQIIILLLSFVPAVQRWFRTLYALSKSPTRLLKDNIRLEDALGRTLSLPFADFRYWEVLEARLRVAFRGVPGDRKVQRGQFLLMNMESGYMIDRETWDRAITPGVKLAMSMLYVGDHFTGLLCPRCHLLLRSSPYDDYTECPSCGFRVKPKEALNLGNNALPAYLQGQICEKMGNPPQISKREQAIDPDMGLTSSELQIFPRIHLIRNPVARSDARLRAKLRESHDNEATDEHTTSNRCIVCGTEFASNFALQQHRGEREWQPRTKDCQSDDKASAYPTDLQRHVQPNHDKERSSFNLRVSPGFPLPPSWEPVPPVHLAQAFVDTEAVGWHLVESPFDS